MPRLSSQRALPRFAAAVGALYDAAASGAPAALAQAGARAAAELIPCESSSYNHLAIHDGRARAALAIAHHPAPPPAGLLAAFEAHMNKHVTFRVVQARGIQEAVLLSDFISSREFRRTAFYQEYYRHRGTRFQLGFAFPAGAASTITVALNRWRRDFSTDDRALLTLLRPHFQRAYDLARTRWPGRENDRRALCGEEAAADRAPALCALGLTPRQAEVLLWTAHGKTNEEIAMILGASRHTVHHHVEAIFARLGVVSRAEATLRALETLGWLRWPQR